MAYGKNGVYVGGSFANVNTTNPANGLALLDPVNGNIVPFPFAATNDSLPAVINALAIDATSLYVGGAFTTVGDLSRRFVAAIDPATAAPATAFNANLGGGFSGVNALAVAGPNLYIGGDFSTANGGSFPRLTPVDTTTGLTNTWSPTPSPNQPVSLLAVNADTLFAVGQFTLISGITLNSFASYSLADNSLLPIDATLPSFSTVTALAATETALYMGGQFSSIGGEDRQNLACLMPSTAEAYDWNPSPDVPPSVIALTDNYAFVGGSFRFMGQYPANRVTGFFAAFSRAPQVAVSGNGAGVQIVSTTGDRTDAVLQGTPRLPASTWTNIATNSPGFVWTNVVPAGSPQQFFRVIAR
jgi:hypothetical protein